jgi:hypothetical protein
MDIEKSYIVLVHEFAANHANDGFTRKELDDYLKLKGIDVEDSVARQNVLSTLERNAYGRQSDGKEKHFIIEEAFYRHLGYLEMKAAKDNAKSASRLSVVAIGISSVLALIQIIIAFSSNGQGC